MDTFFLMSWSMSNFPVLWVDKISKVIIKRIFALIISQNYYFHLRMCCFESVNFIPLNLVDCCPPFNFHAFQIGNWGQLGWSQFFNCKITCLYLGQIRELSNLTNEQLPLFFSELTVDLDDFVPVKLHLNLRWRQWKRQEINFIANSNCDFTEFILIIERIVYVLLMLQIQNVPLDVNSVF